MAKSAKKTAKKAAKKVAKKTTKKAAAPRKKAVKKVAASKAKATDVQVSKPIAPVESTPRVKTYGGTAPEPPRY